MTKKLICLLILCAVPALCFGQSGNIALLKLVSDVRSAGMGGAYMGRAEGMFIYTNPTAKSYAGDHSYAGYSIGIFDKVENGLNLFHSASGGYRFGRNAVMAGFRYMGGQSVVATDADGNIAETYKPKEVTFDIAYARQFGKLSFYVGGGVIQSRVVTAASTVTASAGGYYLDRFYLFGTDCVYNVGVAVRNFGGKLTFDNGSAITQPLSADLGGSLEIPFSADHKLTLAFTGQYYVLPSKAAGLVTGFGAEYKVFNAAAIRAGYHTGNKDNYATVGAGFYIMDYLSFNVSYNFGQLYSQSNKLLRIGAGVSF